ncbi:MAG: hypothetical protein JXB17_08980 [Bacteroidales bacterium]|nr:hypothetical protein [Bacteroidales bacterium]
MRMKLFFGLILFCVLLFSCEKATLDPGGANPDKKYSFAVDVQPLFDSKCVTCHKGTPPPDLQAGNSYKALINGDYINNPVNAEMTELYKILYSSSHDSKTTQVEKDIITYWLKQGADDN